MLVGVQALLQIACAGVTIHNNSDCCCENLPDRSAKNLVASVEECAASCKEAPACHAAVLLDTNVKSQCHLSGSPPPGMKCCLHKGHFDTLHTASSATTVIDMGTSSGPCPHPAPAPTPSPSSLPGRPLYHFTRESGEMNDPNGLLWKRLPDGEIEYHMFHQHGDASCHGFDHTGSHAWGHARSPDLVRWTRMKNSGVCGSTSGGITLVPGELQRHTGWRGAILVSAPSMQAIGNMSVGLHLYTSSDEHLENWTRYEPSVPSPNGDNCVICPSLVPDETNAGNIGDTYVFADPPWWKPLSAASGEQNRTFYVLSGSNICSPEENGGHWCGFGAGTPQSLLFASEDLINWRFKNVFWRGPFIGTNGKPLKAHGSLYTPDTFQLPDGRQVLIYLMQGTLWQIGTFDAENGTFTAEPAPPPANIKSLGAPSRESETAGATAGREQGLGSCGQSLTDAKGRRVQFGWQHISLGVTSGAQSLPRVITATSGSSGRGGLLFSPLPELATLHNHSSHLAKTLSVAPSGGSSGGGRYKMLEPAVIDQQTGLHHHLKLNVSLSTEATGNFSLCVQCDDDHSGVAISVLVDGYLLKELFEAYKSSS